jgi:carboxypeptidase D
MASLRRWLASSIALASSFAIAQFPSTPQSTTTKEASGFPGVWISYKETSICETKAKAWSGYVHMPVSYLRDIEGIDPYDVSMFFWYFEAREDPQNAPTTIYLAGGPGQSSLW